MNMFYALILAVIISAQTAFPAYSETPREIGVMTLNLRYDTEKDGVNRFFLRTDRILETIRAENPDLIGFQEADDAMRSFMREQLPEYTVLGCGSNERYKGTSNLIAFKKDQFELILFETQWLSPTPDTAGSTYGGDQSKNPRLYQLARMIDLETNQVIVFINTHTDHSGKNARLSASHQLLETIRSNIGDPVILVGDFNAYPNSEEIVYLTSDETLPFYDVTAGIRYTFHKWSRVNWGKIDYIFSSLSCKESHIVEDIPVDGVYISDHNPLVTTLFLDSNIED